MNALLRRAATLTLVAPLLLTGAAVASADGPDAGVGAAESSSTPTDGIALRAAVAAPIVPVAPVIDLEDRTYTIPDVAGLRYIDDDGYYLTPGVHELEDWATVVALPAPGSSMVGTYAWSIDVSELEPGWTHVAAPLPRVDVGARLVTVPDDPRVDFYPEEGDSLEPGVTTVPADVDELWLYVVATDEEAYPVVDALGIAFTPIVGYSLQEPTFDLAAGTFTIPDDPRIAYYVDDVETPAGTYRASGTITIDIEIIDPQAAYHWDETSWTVTFPTSTSPFLDVKPGQEHYEHMVWMSDAKISTGWKVSGGYEYRPLAPVNRDAMAAFLYRMAGSPKVTLPKSSPFTDVKPSQEHYTAIIWAYQEGITTGWTVKGTREFRPTTPINRDAMAAFLYRFAGEPTTAAASSSCFRDVSRTQQFAKEMCWMKTQGISTGWSDRTYRPLQSVKRDAMAAFLHRYDAAY
ncbi:S-layer homology domain-containing protein [Brachybacterium sp. J144]|uniref:S-layer homology domain-containing protein n=1 Tax=Brachybacterium sp. J144 TaxID=3116487 RepID=UPI002E759FB0|nr:S-layer homology domain-containing protein [Brachybacterium sp. J144]MEE1650753.1 S-layer homology domain-containing protein [Brachybacterium sp. J144]